MNTLAKLIRTVALVLILVVGVLAGCGQDEPEPVTAAEVINADGPIALPTVYMPAPSLGQVQAGLP